VSFLVAQHFEDRSCAGLHLLQAITQVLAADRQHGILDPATRNEGRKFVEDTLRRIYDSQQSDGAWPIQWNTIDAPSVVAGRFRDQVLVVGHMLELLHSLRDSRLSVRTKATAWMLNAFRSFPDNKQAFGICPLTHALRGVKASYEARKESLEMMELFHH
jgi:hypothetical protein